MNSDTRSVDIVRECYARYARKDFPGLFELVSPEIEISQTEDLPWGGRYCGYAGLKDFVMKLTLWTEAMPEPEYYIPAGDDVVAVGRLRGKARATGLPIDLAIVHVWTIKDGKVVRQVPYIDTPAMHQALGFSEMLDAV